MTDQVQKGAARFGLTLGSTELDNTQLRHINSISFTESMDKLDALSVVFAVPTVDQDKVFDLIDLGNTFEVELGYPGAGTTRMGYGDIMEVSHSISPSSPWSITLTGLDGLHRLKGKAETKMWEEEHGSIIESIASTHSLGITNVSAVDGSDEETFQDNQTDAVFLRRLATEHHYYVRVVKDELHFGRLGVEEVTETIKVDWNKEVESLSLRGSLNGLISSAKATGRDYKASSTQEVIGSFDSTDIQATAEGGQLGVDIWNEKFGTREVEVDNSRRNQSSAANERARREVEDRADKFLSGSMTILGKPEAQSGEKIEIDGLKWPFTGPFLITQTTHTLDPGVGYRTKIDFRANCWPPKT